MEEQVYTVHTRTPYKPSATLSLWGIFTMKLGAHVPIRCEHLSMHAHTHMHTHTHTTHTRMHTWIYIHTHTHTHTRKESGSFSCLTRCSTHTMASLNTLQGECHGVVMVLHCRLICQHCVATLCARMNPCHLTLLCYGVYTVYCMHLHTHAHTQSHTHVHVHVRTYMYLHTYTHMHVHIQ